MTADGGTTLRFARNGRDVEIVRAALGADVPDVGRAAVECIDVLRVDTEAEDGKIVLAEEQGERQADIPVTDDTDRGGAVVEALDERTLRIRCGVFVMAVVDC